MKNLITPDVPSTNELPPVKDGLIRVFFKEFNRYMDITLRFFDKYLHCGLLRFTNYYGWICL
jgi:hypothetical protein